MKKLIVVFALLFSLAVNAQDTIPLCKATTKAGNACKNHAKEGNTLCGVHAANTIRCGFTKKDGNKCQMRVKVAGSRCHHHSGK